MERWAEGQAGDGAVRFSIAGWAVGAGRRGCLPAGRSATHICAGPTCTHCGWQARSALRSRGLQRGHCEHAKHSPTPSRRSMSDRCLGLMASPSYASASPATMASHLVGETEEGRAGRAGASEWWVGGGPRADLCAEQFQGVSSCEPFAAAAGAHRLSPSFRSRPVRSGQKMRVQNTPAMPHAALIQTAGYKRWGRVGVGQGPVSAGGVRRARAQRAQRAWHALRRCKPAVCCSPLRPPQRAAPFINQAKPTQPVTLLTFAAVVHKVEDDARHQGTGLAHRRRKAVAHGAHLSGHHLRRQQPGGGVGACAGRAGCGG